MSGVGTNEAKSGQAKDIEVWVTRGASSHSIIVDPKGYEPEMVQFKDYRLDVDLTTKHGKALSKALHDCTREGRDIFVAGKVYKNNDIEGRTALLAQLAEDNIAQLRARILSLDWYHEFGVDPANAERAQLTNIILEKSRADESEE